MHSPFVFDFILHVLNNKKNYQPPSNISELRNRLQRDQRVLNVTDLGAGSRENSKEKRKVSTIASNAVKPRKYGELLFRLAKHYQCRQLVELGTSLGVTTAYLASADEDGIVYTIEGAEEVARIASDNFEQLSLQNIYPIVGNFDLKLPAVLEKMESVDLAYVDGNHRYAATKSYFNHLIKKHNNNTILVFDDIHWSREMEQAWEEIRRHPEVACTIDIFFLGFVFFRKEFKTRQHHCIRFS
jgi:predicted O-methyltransferase YrrM